MDHKKLLLTILGLTETATDAEISAAAEAFAQKQSTTETQVEAFSTSLQSTTDTLNALTKRLDARERAELIAAAMGEGKIIPHGAGIDSLDNAAFTALLATLPAGQVPLKQRTPEGVKAFSAAVVEDESNTHDGEVRKQLGISQEDWDA